MERELDNSLFYFWKGKAKMSISVRHIRYSENGKEYYYVRNTGVRPIARNLYETIEDMPKDIRHLCLDKTEVEEIGPGMANFLCIGKILCQDLPECDHPYFLNKECLAELCRYAPKDDWHKCPYFKKEKSNG